MPANKKNKKTQQRPVAPKKQAAKVAKQGIGKYYFPLFLIVILSFIVYLPCLKNGFVWDDDIYIQNDPLIHAINLKQIFSKLFMGYQPLTILTFAIEYHFYALSEKGFHIVNLLFHLLNVILVFRVVFLISNKAEVALIASLLFGIHPMHVESVAWACELKDVLYVFFFLAAYICYLTYLKNGQRKFYFYCLLLFLLSLFSKGMATSLTLVLLLTDYLLPSATGQIHPLANKTDSLKKGWKIHARILLEKLPFIALSIIFGIVAVYGQKESGATEGVYFTFAQRIVFASYGFITYLMKLVLPLNLSAFYPYPIKSGDAMPVPYYTYLFLSLGLVAYVLYTLRFTKKIAFGFGFYTVTVLFVLQVFSFGSNIMADRFSYLSSLGIFYLAGEGFYWLWNKKGASMNLKIPCVILLTLTTVFYSFKTYGRCGVWKNGMTLWNDVIDQSPDVGVAYYNRAIFLKDKGKFDEALNDFNKTIELLPKGAVGAYNDRGIIMAMRANYDEAIKDFTTAIALKPDNPEAYLNRGISLQNEKRLDEAMKDYTKAIQLEPDSRQAFFNRGVIKYNSGQKEAACADLKQALILGFPPAEETYNKLCR